MCMKVKSGHISKQLNRSGCGVFLIKVSVKNPCQCCITKTLLQYARRGLMREPMNLIVRRQKNQFIPKLNI